MTRPALATMPSTRPTQLDDGSGPEKEFEGDGSDDDGDGSDSDGDRSDSEHSRSSADSSEAPKTSLAERLAQRKDSPDGDEAARSPDR